MPDRGFSILKQAYDQHPSRAIALGIESDEQKSSDSSTYLASTLALRLTCLPPPSRWRSPIWLCGDAGGTSRNLGLLVQCQLSRHSIQSPSRTNVSSSLFFPPETRAEWEAQD